MTAAGRLSLPALLKYNTTYTSSSLSACLIAAFVLDERLNSSNLGGLMSAAGRLSLPALLKYNTTYTSASLSACLIAAFVLDERLNSSNLGGLMTAAGRLSLPPLLKYNTTYTSASLSACLIAAFVLDQESGWIDVSSWYTFFTCFTEIQHYLHICITLSLFNSSFCTR